MADKLPPTLHPLVPGKSNISFPYKTTKDNESANSAKEQLGNAVEKVEKSNDEEHSRVDCEKEKTNSKNDDSRSSQELKRQEISVSSNELKEGFENKIRTRSKSAPQEGSNSSVTPTEENIDKKKKIFGGYQKWELSSKKNTQSKPNHSSTPKTYSRTDKKNGSRPSMAIVVDMPKAKESKIPKPKMGVVVKSSGGNQYSMKYKPKSENPAPETLENVVLTPENKLQHTIERIGEPEKPRAIGKSNLPLEYGKNISSKMINKPTSSENALRKYYNISNPNMSPVIEIDRFEVERTLAEQNRSREERTQAQRDQLAEELRYKELEKKKAEQQILRMSKKRGRETSGSSDEEAKRQKYIRPGSNRANARIEETRGYSILEDDTIPFADMDDRQIVDLTQSDHEGYVTAGDDEITSLNNTNVNFIPDLSEITESTRPKFIEAAQETQRIIVNEAIPEHEASTITKTIAEVFLNVFKRSLGVTELSGEDGANKLQQHHDQVGIMLANNFGEVNAALVEITRMAKGQINTTVTVEAINRFNELFGKLEEVNRTRTNEGASLQELQRALTNGTEGCMMAATEAGKAANVFQNHPATKLVAAMNQMNDVKENTTKTRAQMAEMRDGWLLFVKTMNEKLEQMEKEQKEKLRSISKMETDQDVPRNQDSNSLQKRYRYQPLSQTENWVHVPEGYVEVVDGSKPRLIPGTAMVKLLRIYDSGRLEEFSNMLHTSGHVGLDGSGGSTSSNIFRPMRGSEERSERSFRSKPYDKHRSSEKSYFGNNDKGYSASGYVRYRVEKASHPRNERKEEKKPRKTWDEIMGLQYIPNANPDDISLAQRAEREFDVRLKGEEQKLLKYIEMNGEKTPVDSSELRLALRELSDQEIFIKYGSNKPNDYIFKTLSQWRDEQRAEMLEETYPYSLSLGRR